MAPLSIDERRVTRLAEECDRIEEQRPRDAAWKMRHAAAYLALANACNLALKNAKTMRGAA